MDLSDLHQHTRGVKFSPDGLLLAAVSNSRLAIRSAETMQIVQLYSCVDKVEMFEWSCDSRYILCAMFKRALVQVRVSVHPHLIEYWRSQAAHRRR